MGRAVARSAPADSWPALERRIALYLDRGATVTPEPGGVTLSHPILGECWVATRWWERTLALRLGAS